MRNWRVRFLRQNRRPQKPPNRGRWRARYPKSPRNLRRKNLRPLRRLPDLLPWRKRAPSQLKLAPLPRRRRCRKSICPTNGRPFSKRRVLARELANLPPLCQPLCQQRPRLDPCVTRSPGTWKSFRLARNLRLLRRPMHLRSSRSMPPAQHLQFRSSRNASPEKRERSPRRPSPNRYHRLKFRRNLLRQASLNSNSNRNMNSYWKRSPWSRPTTKDRPISRLLHRIQRRSVKTPRQHAPRIAVLLPISFLPILPRKSISSASAT